MVKQLTMNKLRKVIHMFLNVSESTNNNVVWSNRNTIVAAKSWLSEQGIVENDVHVFKE